MADEQPYGVPDEENPEWTKEEIKATRPFSDFFGPGKPTTVSVTDLRAWRQWERGETAKRVVALDFSPDEFHLEAPLDIAHQAHLDSVIEEFTTDLRAKYRAGQVANGGNLWEKPGMLGHAIEEVLDLAVYLYTLRQQLQRKGINL